LRDLSRRSLEKAGGTLKKKKHLKEEEETFPKWEEVGDDRAPFRYPNPSPSVTKSIV
jgi:hypothetical protein